MQKALALALALVLAACGDDEPDVICAPPWESSAILPREGWYDVPVAARIQGMRRFAVQYSGYISVERVPGGMLHLPAQVDDSGCFFSHDGSTVCATGVGQSNSAVLMVGDQIVCGRWHSRLDP
jgi:hypothetical protein